ncbi:low temperature requirement protein A [Paractinoplanes brasiliensis]|uniref:Low temperature requirement protein LtrA n=1 Tax=Paractinoplanes brasiliensis TaxID=52695 RepID=A0A4R6J7C8_9ACTN|nr:low temperature requirement protein A [Actinoplanes brasiliensis]TDO31362.1 low temperature requirement protein LtrA [Actinoplanes brasiliensis]GID28308.1 membrane protein [Actinoplanes brasiliensis]
MTTDDRPAPLIRAPRLRTEPQRGASRLELFFDLAYVLVVDQLAKAFAGNLSIGGASIFAGLIVVTWWSWVTTTLYANRFDTNDVIYRLAKLAAAGAVIGMAAAAQGATSSEGTQFALCFLATRVILLLLYARAWRHVPEARHTIVIYIAGAAASCVLWALSLPVEGTPRYALWGAGILVEAAAPLAATRLGDKTPLHLEHLPERFALFVILVLGESVRSIVLGVHEQHWVAASVVSAVVAFTAVAGLWWIYFDLGGAAGKRELEEEGDDVENGVADAYIYGHLPLVVGLAIAAVGVEQFILHPAGELDPSGRWALHGGVALYLAGLAVVMWGTSGRWHAAWPWPTAVIPFVAALGFFDSLEPVLSVAVVTILLIATVLAGMWQQRRGAMRGAEA